MPRSKVQRSGVVAFRCCFVVSVCRGVEGDFLILQEALSPAHTRLLVEGNQETVAGYVVGAGEVVRLSVAQLFEAHGLGSQGRRLIPRRSSLMPAVRGSFAGVCDDAGHDGLQSGQCIDCAPDSGAVSTCSLEPALGWPGSVLLALVSLVALGYCINRVIRTSG